MLWGWTDCCHTISGTCQLICLLQQINLSSYVPAICKLHNGATILFLLKMWAVIGASNRVPPKLICYLQPVAFIPRVLLNMEQIKRLILNNHFTMNTLWSLHLHLAIIIQSSCNGSIDSFTFMSASAKNYRHVYLLVSKTRTATTRLFL